MPEVAGIAQEITDLVGLGGIEAQRPEGELNPAGLYVMRVQVHDHEHDITEVCYTLTITNELLIIYRMKAEASIDLG
jgi:hypothetical protein